MSKKILAAVVLSVIAITLSLMPADTAMSQEKGAGKTAPQTGKTDQAAATPAATPAKGAAPASASPTPAATPGTGSAKNKEPEKTDVIKNRPPSASEQEKIELATPEEFKSYLDSERQAIAREKEALLALKMQVKQETEKLIALQKQIEEKLTKEDEKQNEKIKKLVKIYSVMRPDEVGPLLSKLDDDLALKVLSNMKPKTQADLLARMTPEKAAEISKKLTSKDF
jgi:flagellar motility protein MotE (MotC chaperone)